MPPNPERQARMRAKREAFDNDPAMQQMSRDVGQRVLQGYERPAAVPIEPPAAAPRPMLPNYYRNGGSIRKPTFARGGSVQFGTDYRKGK
jgi:hypothetical protein